MAQHFLLTAAARTLSLGAILRMTDDEAQARFEAIRFADNGGAALCPRCQCTAVYTYAARRIWKCKACGHQFSVTSGTIFASHKLPIRDYLAAICIFVNAVKGISALQLGRDLDVQYKTAFVLAHKLREAIGSHQAEFTLSGVVELTAPSSAAMSKPAHARRTEPDGASGQAAGCCCRPPTWWPDAADRGCQGKRRDPVHPLPRRAGHPSSRR